VKRVVGYRPYPLKKGRLAEQRRDLREWCEPAHRSGEHDLAGTRSGKRREQRQTRPD
jgi:hypothetical protein